MASMSSGGYGLFFKAAWVTYNDEEMGTMEEEDNNLFAQPK